ncbi:MAG TPA: hypothetical protein VGB95_01435, partial [Chitinophagales bacterium]
MPNFIWHEFIPQEKTLMQFPYLEIIERLHSNQFRFYYVLLEEANKPIAFFYFQETNFFGTNLLPYFPSTEQSNFFKKIGANFLSFFKLLIAKVRIPMLVVGNIFMTGETGCVCINPDDKEEIHRLQMLAIDAICKCDWRIKVVLNGDLYESQMDELKAYRESNFRKIFVEDDNAMDISKFGSYEDYLSALHSKYRVREKRIMKMSEKITSKVLSLEDVLLLQYPIYALYKRVADKVDFKLGELDKHFFYEQKQLLPENYFLRAYFLEDNLCGFVSLYTLDNHAEVHYFGMDYSLLKEYHLYQRMLYDTLQFCIEKNLSHIHFGRTAPEVK